MTLLSHLSLSVFCYTNTQAVAFAINALIAGETFHQRQLWIDLCRQVYKSNNINPILGPYGPYHLANF